VYLFERTTRSVRLTPAGAHLLAEAVTLFAGLGATVRGVHEKFADAPKVLRVGISRSIGLSYLPGFFNIHGKEHPETSTDVVHDSSAALLGLLEGGELDVGLVTVISILPKGLVKTQHFADAFTLIIPPAVTIERRSKSLLMVPELRKMLPNNAGSCRLRLQEPVVHSGAGLMNMKSMLYHRFKQRISI